MSGRVGDHLGAAVGTVLLAVGVVTGAVTVPALLLAAWLENLSSGVATVAALVRASRRPRRGGHRPAAAPPADPPTAPRVGRVTRAGCAVPAFVVPFGAFAVAHGIVLATAATWAAQAADPAGPRTGAWGVLFILASATVRAFRRTDPTRAVVQAYAGLLPFQLGVLVLTFALLGAPGAWGSWWVGIAIVALLVGSDVVREAAGRWDVRALAS